MKTAENIIEQTENTPVISTELQQLIKKMRERIVTCCMFAHEDRSKNGVDQATKIGIPLSVVLAKQPWHITTNTCPNRSTNLACAHPRDFSSPADAFRADYVRLITAAEEQGFLQSLEHVPDELLQEFPNSTSEAEIMKKVLLRASETLLGLDYGVRFMQKTISEQLTELPELSGESERTIGKTPAPQCLVDAGIYTYTLDNSDGDVNIKILLEEALTSVEGSSRLLQYIANNPKNPHIRQTLTLEKAKQIIAKEQMKAGKQIQWVNDRLLEVFSK